jgi:hypothetical protein
VPEPERGALRLQRDDALIAGTVANDEERLAFALGLDPSLQLAG